MNKQRVFFGANWKMHKTRQEAVDYINSLQGLLQAMRDIEQAQIFVLPPFTAIDAAKRASAGKLWIGAQNMHWAESGAYTGEISASMLEELRVDLVQLGHVERRRYFNETDAEVNCKVHAALSHGLRPLVCVGEQAEDKASGVAREVLGRQVRVALKGVKPQEVPSLMIAYEPVWSVGVEGAHVSADYVRTIREYIRGILSEQFGPEGSARVPIIYGGAVNEDNCATILIKGQVDGLFVGRVGREADTFANLVRICLRAMDPQPVSPDKAL
jgi:L-erythrulose 1-phosphate isomerase